MEPRLSDLTAAYDRQDRARAFVKWIHAHALAGRGGISALDALEGMSGVETIRKAAIEAHTTGNSSALLRESRAFLELVARRTVRGRLVGTLNAPPNTPIPTPDTDPVGAWAIEGQPIPCASISFSAPRIDIAKFGFILAFSDAVVKLIDPRNVNLVEAVSLRATVRAEDTLLLSDTAAVPFGNPAGLLYGLSPGVDGSPTTLTADLSGLWTQVADGDPDWPHFIVSPRGAMYLAALNTDGTPLFPHVSPATGGNIYGVPVILAKAAAEHLILIDAAKLAVTDEGLELSRSTQASVQMVDNPATGATTEVSAFMTNTSLVRFVRYVSWVKLSDDAVAYLDLPIAGSPS